MKIMTIVGTRPELIRLSTIIPLLDKYCDKHIFVHTGQNFDPNLKDIFFEDLNLRLPDYQEDCAGDTTFKTISNILQTTERLILKERPDKLLILGDTNSGLSAIVAKRYGVKVYHMEAGNRCFNDIVPEEINRRIIDHCTDVWMPYTERSRQYLLREGIAPEKIFVTGNPIFEVLNYNAVRIGESNILNKFKLCKGEYFLVTMHRAENVDSPRFMEVLCEIFHEFKKIFPVIISVHPHTRERLSANWNTDGIILSVPFNFVDFVNLEQNAYCVITDSGTVQEECSILGIPHIIIRKTNERLETVESGSSIICGHDPKDIARGVEIAVDLHSNGDKYITPIVSNTVIKIILGAYP
jgi:UDP-N-acetylglucosamine 2-epimerase (non-hydrolysing)